jgi:hypothetical protein
MIIRSQMYNRVIFIRKIFALLQKKLNRILLKVDIAVPEYEKHEEVI